MKRVLGVVFAVMTLVGCGASDDAAKSKESAQSGASELAIVYDCSGQEIKVDFDNTVEPQTAQLFFTGKEHTDMILPLVVSASGAKYSDGTVTFWTRQGDATLMMENDGASIACMQQNMTDDEVVIKDTYGNAITPGCKAWFDGCNNCQVGDAGELACTRKYCAPENLQLAQCLEVE